LTQPIPATTQKIKTIEFRVNSQITYFSPEQFKTEEGKSFFEKGQEKQDELNAASAKIENLRNQYQLARSSEERNRIGQDIIPLETEIYFIKEEATHLFLQAENEENNYWRNVPEKVIEDFLNEQEKYITSDKGNFEKQAETDFDSEFKIDPSILFQDRVEIIKNQKSESDELIYKIQIGAYSKTLPANIDRLFKKLAVLRKIENYTDERGVVVYTTGNLTNYEDAERMRLQVKQEGAEDAIVVPYFNRKRITLEEAKKIENNL
jgi:predicted metal-dependent hydrolase